MQACLAYNWPQNARSWRGPLQVQAVDDLLSADWPIGPVAEAQIAIARRVCLCDAPDPSLRIGVGIDDRESRSSAWHGPLVPGAEIPGHDDAAGEVRDTG